ncbi:biotin--[acetyl-CoA-carboxylase] ligase [Mycobacterium sp. NPDC006124]|uniref:biotin--[acetyl-CoA-carboxylase] ligase n=1 Tax=Mycobacterium sp. NPDC006124 TaxID=3156729 RepID=UPI0033B722CF
MVADDAVREPYDEDRLRAAVTGGHGGWRKLTVVAETPSTNADLVRRATDGEDVAGVVLVAEHQIAGVGRHGRAWLSAPMAQILVSVGVDATHVPVESWGWLSLACGTAVVDALSSVTGIVAGLKWPNDVLAGGGKIAGILSTVAKPTSRIVVGIGLNVSLQLDEIADVGATSVHLLSDGKPDRQVLLIAMLEKLRMRIDHWQTARGADETLESDYRARSLTLGQRVRVSLPGGRDIFGTASTLDHQGRLGIMTARGTVFIAAADIVHLRPTGTEYFPRRI